MTHLKESILIEAPMNAVYDVAADPHRWPDWFVGVGEAESIEGDVVKHFYSMVGRRISLNTKIAPSHVDASGVRHWSCQHEGDLRGWQKWDLVPQENGTLVKAETEYMMPGAVMGKGMKLRYIERCQERVLRQTLQNLKDLCEV